MLIAQLLLRRLLLLVPLLLGILFATFMLVRISGQDPVALIGGPTASAEELAVIRHSMQLDRPLFIQFATYLQHAAHGDLGTSWVSNRPVLGEMMERVPATLELLVPGIILGAAIGTLAGLVSAFRAGRLFDHVTRVVSVLGFSVPTYWLGLTMLFVFFYLLGWAPPGMGRISLMVTPPDQITGSYLLDALLAGDWEAARSSFGQLVLPVLCVAILAAAPIAKQTRSIIRGVMGSEFVRYAAAQGLPSPMVQRMALRNSQTALVTYIATEVTAIAGSMSLIEYVFAWGGVGQYGLNAIIASDFAVVQAYVLLLAVFSVLVFLAVDVAVLAFDPRTLQHG